MLTRTRPAHRLASSRSLTGAPSSSCCSARMMCMTALTAAPLGNHELADGLVRAYRWVTALKAAARVSDYQVDKLLAALRA